MKKRNKIKIIVEIIMIIGVLLGGVELIRKILEMVKVITTSDRLVGTVVGGVVFGFILGRKVGEALERRIREVFDMPVKNEEENL